MCDRLLTVPEVAEILAVSRRWVYDHAAKGTLPSGFVGGHLRFRAEDVQDYLEEAFTRRPRGRR